jgi:DeoR family transcriptional regulator, aga operon transcriptional repressor
MGTRETRTAQLQELIRSGERVSIQDMVERFGVSAVTIRKDLDELEQRGAIIRTFGGAVIAPTPDREVAFAVRSQWMDAEKKQIGLAAARLIGRGESVIVDAGSTALEVVRHLRGAEDVNIITPALNVALEAGCLSGVTVIVPGPGVFDQISEALEGPDVEEAMRRFHADKFFMGIRSIDLEHGFMDTDMRRVRVKHSMMRAARETIAVADSSKIGKTSLVQIARLEAVKVLVTDEGIDPEMLEKLTRSGIQVHVAHPEGTQPVGDSRANGHS